MNRDQIAGNWKQLKGSIQQKWGKITNDDLDVAKGDLQILIGKVQERYGKKREEAEREVNEWWDSVSQPGTDRIVSASSSPRLADSEDEIIPADEIDRPSAPERDVSDTAKNVGRDRNPGNLL